MVRSPGFVSNSYNIFALLKLAFTTATPDGLTKLYKLTRWIVLQKARRHSTKLLRLLIGTRFQELFHSPSGVLLTFPSRYLYAIDHKTYLVLEGGPPRFRQGCTCPVLLETLHGPLRRCAVDHAGVVSKRLRQLNLKIHFRIPGYHRLWLLFPEDSANKYRFRKGIADLPHKPEHSAG